MSATMTAEWKPTSLSSFAKTFITRDVPIAGAIGLVLYLGNHIVQGALSADAYSTLVSWFEIGATHLFTAFVAFQTLLSAAAFGASVYTGVYRGQPLALCVRMGIMSLLATIGFAWLLTWLLIHLVQGDLDVAVTGIATSLGT